MNRTPDGGRAGGGTAGLGTSGCGDEIPAGAAPTATPTAGGDINAAGESNGAGESKGAGDVDAAEEDTEPDDEFSIPEDADYAPVTVELTYAAGVDSAQISVADKSGGWGMGMGGEQALTQRFPKGRVTYKIEATVEGTDGRTRTLKDTATFTLGKDYQLTITVSPTSMKIRQR